jgi:hypothetical protein
VDGRPTATELETRWVQLTALEREDHDLRRPLSSARTGGHKHLWTSRCCGVSGGTGSPCGSSSRTGS